MADLTLGGTKEHKGNNSSHSAPVLGGTKEHKGNNSSHTPSVLGGSKLN